MQDWAWSSETCCCDLWLRRTLAALPSDCRARRGRRCSPRPSGSPACRFCGIHPSTLPVSHSRLVAAAARRRSLRHLFAVAPRQAPPSGSATADQLRRAFDDIRGQDGSESERPVCGQGSVGVQEGRHQPSGAEAGGFRVGL